MNKLTQPVGGFSHSICMVRLIYDEVSSDHEGYWMDAQPLLEYVAGSGSVDRVEILNSIRDEAMPESELADYCGVSRGAVQFPADIDGFLVKQLEDQDDYYLTGAGAIAIREYQDARNEVVGDDLDSLIRNPNQRICLRNLHVQPLNRSDLTDRPNMPSRRTVNRLTGSLEDAGYITRTADGEYTLTDSGGEIIKRYEELIQAFEQIIAKKECLEWLGVEVENLPALALENARLEVTRPGQAFKAVYEILEYAKTFDADSIDHVRVMSSFANNEFDKTLERFVDAGAQMEVLSPAELLYEYPSMPLEDLEWSRRLLEPTNSSWLLHRGTLPCSIIVFDEKAVTISPTYTGVSGDTFGVLFSTNPDVIQWVIGLFEDHVDDNPMQASQWPRMAKMMQTGEYVGSLNAADCTESSS